MRREGEDCAANPRTTDEAPPPACCRPLSSGGHAAAPQCVCWQGLGRVLRVLGRWHVHGPRPLVAAAAGRLSSPWPSQPRLAVVRGAGLLAVHGSRHCFPCTRCRVEPLKHHDFMGASLRKWASTLPHEKQRGRRQMAVGLRWPKTSSAELAVCLVRRRHGHQHEREQPGGAGALPR